MKPRNPVVEWITDPTKNFLTSFLVGTLLFTIVSDGVSALFWEKFSPWLQARLGMDSASVLQGAIELALVLLILILIYVTPFSRWLKRRLVKAFGLNAPPNLQTHAQPLRETFPGLIALMSPTSPERESPAERAILHHLNGGENPHLLHCWLICTPQTEAAARELHRKSIDWGFEQDWALHYGSRYEFDGGEDTEPTMSLCIPEAFIDDPVYIRKIVDRIYAHAREQYGLEESEIIADFTGGTKSMSAGMLLACASAARRLQYISQLGSRELMEIEIAYKLLSDDR